MDSRPNSVFYYLNIAEAVSKRSTCLSKQYGAVIVKDHHIVSTGYNGSPRGRINCTDRGKCIRIENKIKRGTNYETGCRSVHSEQNAIIMASAEELQDSTMYLYGYDLVNSRVVENAAPCPVCKRMIINAGIRDVIVADLDHGIGDDHFPYKYNVIHVSDWIENDDSLGETGY